VEKLVNYRPPITSSSHAASEIHNSFYLNGLAIGPNIVTTLQVSDNKGLRHLRSQFSPTYPQRYWI
jgi:hypothetical protein